jgi:hypothetical protein
LEEQSRNKRNDEPTTKSTLQRQYEKLIYKKPKKDEALGKVEIKFKT